MALLDLFRSKVFNSNPSIRISELKKISDANQDLFANIIKKDKNADVRKVAIQRLSAWEAIEWAALNETNDDNKALANKKLGEIAFKEARTIAEFKDAEIWFNRINQAKHLQELAKNAASIDIRKLAIQQIDKENFLTDLVLIEQDIELAKIALTKITKPAALQKIYKNAKSADIRLLVKDQVISHKTEAVAKEEPTQNFDLAKRKVILSKLASFNQRSKVLAFTDEFEYLNQEWSKLAINSSDAENNSFLEFVENFNAKKSNELAEKKALEYNQSRLLLIEAQVQEFSQSLQNYTDLYAATDEGKVQLQELQKEWRHLQSENSDVKISENLILAVNNAFNKIRSIQERVDSQALDAEEKEERRKDILAQLEAISNKSSYNFNDAKHLKKILKDWESLGPISEEQEEVENKFKVLESKISAALEKIEEEIQAIQDKKVSALHLIIEAVKKIEIGDKNLNSKIRDANIQWKDTIGDDKMKFEELYQEFREVQSPFAEVRQWEQWHNEKEKTKLVEEALKLSEVENEEELFNSIKNLQDRWKKSGPIPQNKHQELWDKFKVANDANYARCTSIVEKLELTKQENLKEKYAIVAAAKELVSDIQNWKDAAEALHQLQDNWKSVGPTPREEQQVAWVEFKSHIDSFYTQRKEFFKSQDAMRDTNLDLKIKLCEKAEGLASKDVEADTKEWSETSKSLIDLQKEWKTIGPVPRDKSDEIWKRLRTACDGFFNRKKLHYEQLDSDRAGNLDVKNLIITELNEAINNLPDDIFTFLSDIRERWNEAGSVPRKDSDKIWELFGNAQDQIIDAGLAKDPKFANKIKSDIEAKKKLLERAHTVAESSQWSGTAEVLKEMQQEWKELNRIGSQEKIYWDEFREICDSFFDRRKDQYEIMEQTRLNNLADKEDLLKQAQDIASRPVSGESQREIKHLRTQWKEIGQVPKKYSDRIWKDFNTACDSCFPKREDD